MAVSPGDHLRLTVSSTMPLASIAQNVFYTRIDSLGGGDDNTVLFDLQLWVESIYLQLRPIISNKVTQVLLEVAIQVLGGAITPVGSKTLSIVGNSGAQMTSHGVAGQSNMTLNGGGRPSIKFWPGVNEAGVEDGEFLPFDITVMLAAAAAVVLGANQVASLGSYTPGIVTGDTLNFKTFTGTIAAKTLPGYQRRRKPGVGI